MYDTFNRFMEDKAADAEDNLSIICNRLKHFDFGDGCLFIMHFRSFTPVEYRAIGEIMQSLDVCAVMCCDDIKRPSALFAPISDTCRKLTEIAAEHNTECEEPMCVFDRDNGRELTFLRKAYFSPTASRRQNRKCFYKRSIESLSRSRNGGRLDFKALSNREQAFFGLSYSCAATGGLFEDNSADIRQPRHRCVFGFKAKHNNKAACGNALRIA